MNAPTGAAVTLYVYFLRIANCGQSRTPVPTELAVHIAHCFAFSVGAIHESPVLAYCKFRGVEAPQCLRSKLDVLGIAEDSAPYGVGGTYCALFEPYQ